MHPEWELDTRHGHFETAAAAALAANGFGTDGVEELRLEHGRLALIDVQGRRARPRVDIAVWKRTDGHLALPSEMLFERVECSSADLSAMGLDGGFDARQYRIVDNDTGEDVRVRVVLGRSRVLLVLDSADGTTDQVPSA